jgi:hypothetical protein
MIDFDESAVFKLKPIQDKKILEPIYQFLIDGEEIFSAFKTVRDQLAILLG